MGLKIAPKYKIGLRTIKTSLAVFLCLVVQFIFQINMLDTFYAVIAAIVCMRQTPEESLDMGVHRFVGTLIGGVVGFILINLAPYIPYYDDGLYIVIVPLCMILCISSCVWINKKIAVVICCVVFLGIALDPTLNKENTISYVALRIIFTTIGIIIATLLNKYFFPYKEEEEFPE